MDELKLYKNTLLASLGFYFNMKISPSDREKKFINETEELCQKLRKSIKFKHTKASLRPEEKSKNFINIGDWIVVDKEINIKDLLRSKNVSFKDIEMINNEVYEYCVKYDQEGFLSKIFPKFVPVYKLLEVDRRIFINKEDCK
tara:strand:- start:875 stop:1303 length:429 start_codon:yes stop_codon:yes gene_type:complete